MTDNKDRLDKLEAGKNAYGEVSGNPKDRLAEVEPEFLAVDEDPFDLFMLEDRHQEITDATYNQWTRTFDQWRNFMEAQGRHPACPSSVHVSKFVRFQTEELENSEGDVKSKLFRVNAAYEWMQEDGQIPAPTDYNPYKKWLKKGRLSTDSERSYPRISLDELRERVNDITNIRERALTVTHLKLGCRSSELANINLADISIEHDELREHYTEMGTHPKIEQYENVVYIPSERDGNKREVDTILPLDEETRQAIVDWLLIRPDNSKDALFFTDKGKRPAHNDIAHFWKKYWWPEYKFGEDEYYDSITPHWCRHHFTSWWSTQGIPRVQRKYMRGDRTDEYNRRRSAMDAYMHEYFENIEPVYREGIFQLRLDKV
ncbi:tyrosine-type recombinase/integrase [Natronosalvus caseinilyticus]|uniref:tyrosine-type recombinase/integrase n=1 Tax=Natronosalvus caseinilyticus TaxID=2953747 RepID=UPI0028ACB8A8|nr:site-specific integrase [Natronosalvus caseinilyticus]